MKRTKIFLLALFLIGTVTMSMGQEKYITTSDSVKLYINVKGSGIPCLFIHGGPGQGSNYWEKLAGYVGGDAFQMIYLDQRGCGRSSSPKDSNYSPERMIKDFEEVRQALNIDDWFIMGHSFGGILQTIYAQKHSPKIKGILMFNCTLNMVKSLEECYIPFALETLQVKDRSLYTDPKTPFVTRIFSLQALMGKSQDSWKLSFESPESQMKFGMSYAGFESWNMDFLKLAFGIEDYCKDFTRLTPDIEVPVLFLYGKKDHNTGVNHYQEVKFPNMLLYPIEGGHMAFIDAKAEYSKAVEDFLKRFKIEI